jgi:hypothetical protein
MLSVFNLSIFGRLHQSPLVCRAQAQAILCEARANAMRQIEYGLDDRITLREKWISDNEAAWYALNTCTRALQALNSMEAICS